MKKGVFKIATIGGIDVKLHWSWLLILLLMTFSLAVSWFPLRMPRESPITYWALGFVASILLFVSVLLHELAHSFVALARGLKVNDIVLYMFGGASSLEDEPETPGDEFLIAVVGPLTSLGLAGLFLLLWVLFTPVAGNVGDWASNLFFYLAYINGILAVFNLIPGFPLDGGRVLRSIIWGIIRDYDRATRYAGIIGQLAAYGFISIGLVVAFYLDNWDGLWLAFIGWFLLNAARQSVTGVRIREAVKGVTVAQVMEKSPPVVGPTYTIAHLLSQYILPGNLRVLPVVQEGRLLGIVTLSDLENIPQEEWGTVTAVDVMTGSARLRVAHPSDRLDKVMDTLMESDFDQLPVVDARGTLVGMLTRAHILRWLKLREELQQAPRATS
ncbi:MAG: site-2 protease family protein [Chloroflexota bacterium]|nr:site-2 protease family protein [Chloroflexota bacterium]MDQ5865199.1 site-2 protease family protein [Chloroflexota bacterium]